MKVRRKSLWRSQNVKLAIKRKNQRDMVKESAKE